MTSTLTLAALALATSAVAVQAQDVTLRIHHFMSERANLHTNFLVPLEQRLEEVTDGRIEVELFAAMSLGGRPGDLYDQAVDGAVDIVLTLPGYTSGRFNKTEVFELPFMMADAVPTSMAFYDLIEGELQDAEYEEVKVLSAWVHGPGVVHSAEPINTLEDLKGKDLRGPTRLATDLLGELGANPVGMPLPSIPENLSKGVINGTLLPWEVTPSIKLAELVKNHTELGGERALYTATFVLAMNWDAYDAMPDDLRDILDAETGKPLAAMAGQVMVDADAGGRDVALEAGNSFVRLEAAEVDRWIEAAAPVRARFVARAEEKGFDGAALIEQAEGLIAANK